MATATVVPCLWFDGKAEEAAKFYTSLLPNSHVDRVWHSPALVEVDGQAEVDRLWDKLTANGGEPGPCGWLKDRFGLSWQIIPKQMTELLADPEPDRARRAMEEMLKMGKIEIAELERAADAA